MGEGHPWDPEGNVLPKPPPKPDPPKPVKM
jgi:hypothetical protein